MIFSNCNNLTRKKRLLIGQLRNLFPCSFMFDFFFYSYIDAIFFSWKRTIRRFIYWKAPYILYILFPDSLYEQFFFSYLSDFINEDTFCDSPAICLTEIIFWIKYWTLKKVFYQLFNFWKLHEHGANDKSVEIWFLLEIWLIHGAIDNEF